MTEPHREEIDANLGRAGESVEAARTLVIAGYYDSAASRAYYAAFYAATSALLREGIKFRKHRGVIAGVHHRFVKTGKMDKRFGKDLNWLFELRGVGDYGETQRVTRQEAEKAIELAEAFVQVIRELIDRP
ncbi:MAG: HEPN domain-containing protein [bacterium]